MLKGISRNSSKANNFFLFKTKKKNNEKVEEKETQVVFYAFSAYFVT